MDYPIKIHWIFFLNIYIKISHNIYIVKMDTPKRSEAMKRAHKKYKQTEKGKQKHKETNIKYKLNPEVQERIKAYNREYKRKQYQKKKMERMAKQIEEVMKNSETLKNAPKN